MKPSSLLKRLSGGIFALGFALAGTAFGQGITTSAMSGTITDRQGKAVTDATITITHDPSGTSSTAVSRANGQYNISGLRVGGPYTVAVTAAGQPSESRTDVYLDLGAAQDVSFTLGATTVVMDVVKVSVERDVTFGAGKITTGTVFTDADIANIASVRRNVQDFAQLDSRVYLGSYDQGGQLSAQGQNFRFNSFLIDGVQANDTFGLNSNGFSSLRSPIPPEAMLALNTELSPYDARRAGFTGALMNAVTKSGTNQFRGSLYYEYTDQDWRAKNPVTQVRDVFKESTFGATLGGPILPGKLFFFASYDHFKREIAPPSQNFVPDSAIVQAITTRAGSFGSFNPGSFSASNEPFQKTYLGKLDWNIVPGHRASFTYRKNEGQDTVFSNFSGATTTSFSTEWYDQPRKTDSYTGQFFSTWTPNLRTEVSASFTKYDGSPASRSDGKFPEVQIQNVSGRRLDTGAAITNGAVYFGTEFSRQLNAITTKTRNATFAADYSMGDHTFMFGGDYEKTEITNKFVQAFLGSYTFTNPAAWTAGTASNLQVAVLAPGATVDDAIARFDLGMYGLYFQDTWKPSTQLTLVGGLRLDYPEFSNNPKAIPTTPTYSEASFRTAFGIPSTTSGDGNYTISPRLGFVYELKTDRKTQLRGGVGLFQGRSPSVYLSNAYSNRGVAARVTQNNVPFTATVTPGTGAAAVAVINLTDPDFRQPVSWKGNLAIDHTLPFGGIVLTLEVSGIQAYRAIQTENLNLKPVGTMPDGRIRYAGVIAATTATASRSSASNTYRTNDLYQNAGFADVYKFTNSRKGGGEDFTFAIRRPMKRGLGGLGGYWAGSLAWTRSDYTEVSPSTSSVAQSNYNNRAVFNPNENVDSISNTNIKDRIVATLTHRFELVKNYPTTIAAIYQARAGHPYSWVYFADSNGDGFTFNDLFYVPSGPTDPKVRWTSIAERDAFFDFVNSSTLRKYAGSVAPRNSEVSPWMQTLDLKFTQEIPMPGYNRVKFEAFANIINLGNLLNKNWGLIEEVPFSYKRAVAATTLDTATNQYVYTFNSTTLNTVPIVARDTPESRWQIQLGAKVRF
ncbi:MAG: TonB-dependent receptor [Verrucomicrobia bacterium]|nr:TonB-dependent receptor [Verrucomicrobiota bacterium]